MPGTNWIVDLAWLSEQIGLRPRTVCECGVGPLDIAIAPSFIEKCKWLLLVEPHPVQHQRTLEHFTNMKTTGLTLVQACIGFESGTGLLALNNGSSYLQGTWAPTSLGAPKTVLVDKIRFDSIDDGEIDILNLDCEGMEWAVLKHMRSSPRLLMIELYEANPYIDEIRGWLRANQYKLRISTGPQSEQHLFEQCTP